MYGGMGFIWEVDCYLYYWCVKMFGFVLGGEWVWKEKLIISFE